MIVQKPGPPISLAALAPVALERVATWANGGIRSRIVTASSDQVEADIEEVRGLGASEVCFDPTLSPNGFLRCLERVRRPVRAGGRAQSARARAVPPVNQTG